MIPFACFNELSVEPLCSSETSAEQRVQDFLIMLKDVRNLTKITKVRHAGDLTTIRLTPTITLQDYLNTHMRQPTMVALLGVFTHPQVDMNDDTLLQKYFDTTVDVELDDGYFFPADGFNAAYCQNTFCVGFDSKDVWKNINFNLRVTSNGKSRFVNWVCISSHISISLDEDNKYHNPDFDKWLNETNVELVKTSLHPDEKPIKVREDHGKHELIEHAKQLNLCPYVEGILSSLPFEPHNRDYIHKIYDDGIIDIVLCWEDCGYSMRVKTTGRNVVETTEIAHKLRDKFGRG